MPLFPLVALHKTEEKEKWKKEGRKKSNEVSRNVLLHFQALYVLWIID